jgi:hypothetical protein
MAGLMSETADFNESTDRKFTSVFIGPQIPNVKRNLSLFPGP